MIFQNAANARSGTGISHIVEIETYSKCEAFGDSFDICHDSVNEIEAINSYYPCQVYTDRAKPELEFVHPCCCISTSNCGIKNFLLILQH
jgi:hypothetical protein